MPTIFLSHGAPPLADDTAWAGDLSRWSDSLPTPTAVLVISAHWEEAPLSIGATTTVPLNYDFFGFERRFYEVTYRAPGAPELADAVEKLVAEPGQRIYRDSARGLDHGAYVPLVEMYPAAQIPVLQMSMPTLEPNALFELGQRLAPLRDEGVLILGSGFSTHNLQTVNFAESASATPPGWSSEFDDWLDRALTARDIDTLIDFQNKAPAARLAHPRTEHFAPLFVALGAAADDSMEVRTAIDGFWYGLSKRSVEIA